MHVQNLMNSLWDIRIFLGLVPKESPCVYEWVLCISALHLQKQTSLRSVDEQLIHYLGFRCQ